MAITYKFMKVLLFSTIVFLLVSCGRQFHFTSSKEADTDTSYIYTLPYPKGKNLLLVQGYNSSFSHRGRLGLDFKMRSGSPVTAARDGIVVGTQENFTKGGINKKYYHKANYVIVRHSDGTQAYYGHLHHNGVAVAVGDTVHIGQVLAYSGSTGYSLFPHLHFMVWQPAATSRKQVPTRFRTQKGDQYLRPGHWYTPVRPDSLSQKLITGIGNKGSEF